MPKIPYAKGSKTSKAAAKRVAKVRTTIGSVWIDLMARPDGAIAPEVMQEIEQRATDGHMHKVKYASVTGRQSELMTSGVALVQGARGDHGIYLLKPGLSADEAKEIFRQYDKSEDEDSTGRERTPAEEIVLAACREVAEASMNDNEMLIDQAKQRLHATILREMCV